MAAHMVAKEYRLIGPTMEQPHYNMFHRDRVEEEYKLIYKTVGLGTTIWSPLASGTLTDKYLKEIPTGTRMDLPGEEWLKTRSLTQEKLHKIRGLNNIALELNTSLAKLAVSWCIQNKNVSTAILGASKIIQLKETLSSIDLLPLMTEEVNHSIEQILQNKPKETKY
jgi:aryl-alcohol dehydrogenase-like predicted oxidoreductase